VTGQAPHVTGLDGDDPESLVAADHANTLANTTDISGEVKRRFLPDLKAGVSTPPS